MKKFVMTVTLFSVLFIHAQEHFSGISMSYKAGILNGTVNPAALANLQDTYSFNALSVSAYASNNKLGFSDLINSKDFEQVIFSGNKPGSMRLDFEILGPSFAYKFDKWVFSITTSAKTKANIVDIDNTLGNAILNNTMPESATAFLISHNQKASATTWGEIGFGIARELFSIEGHTLNTGVNIKMLMPGTYGRINASDFEGEFVFRNNSVALTNASSNLSFAYSGALGDDFSKKSNFINYFGSPGGVSTDVGLNYNWKKNDDELYTFNAGIALRNMGSMAFKDTNNQSSSYVVNIPEGQYLDLAQFQGDDDIKSIEQKLLQSGFAQITNQRSDFKVKLPATLALYADVRLYNNFFLGGYLQQKLNPDYEEAQISVQNIFTITPRFATEKFEAYLPISSSEISGFAMGAGIRYRGFFIGSGSILTAAFNNSDTHQADIYTGFRFAL